ncbi:ATP-binding cassette domain-containing protein [Cutibacterium avidum]|uniref:ABC transporter ATP-binding protein n=2 Tax=Cutibacterium avidum TaxID=33010 RepID=UPI0008F5D841|nr:ATP-binding cassette domain-containing protein [Cutibacterium avidum]MCO6631373.1 ATP-binding cassette domain-containing protein [Cutibacterium avidum]MCO6659958.1 ATP-binding cassette domain-containing protein [Cutibacterium avidum]MCO6664624.1 ATP-binding cassette domain-containing protein [Cutibacterium avidum]MCX8466450.1 ATP-binding cassette domain-containing protein [Cutibacterium avidum]MCX8468838.1 ATP-binding cassette domain-containing protein [Cutibacterium avidum]
MIRFDHVSKRFDEGTVAVENFDLEVESHHLVVLLGSSGCGKTTLLRMVNRMVDPSEGRVLIDDTDVATVDPVKLRRQIGYVMQSGGLLPHRTVVDNIATVPLLSGASRSAARSRAMDLLERVGLDSSLARRYPTQLSGGQRQRVGVARALAANPDILLMDEPFGAVDPVVRAELQQGLLRIQEDLAKTIVFVTHDVDEAFLLGDEVLVLRHGAQVAQRGRPDEILLHPVDDFVSSFIGGDRRSLHVERRDESATVVDAGGRLVGRLTGTPEENS